MHYENSKQTTKISPSTALHEYNVQNSVNSPNKVHTFSYDMLGELRSGSLGLKVNSFNVGIYCTM